MCNHENIKPLQISLLINQFDQYHATISTLNLCLSGPHPRYYVFHQHNEILEYMSSEQDQQNGQKV